MTLVQQLNDEILAKILHAFPLEEVTHSSRWGNKTWAWGDLIEPSISLAFYSATIGSGKVEVMMGDDVVSTNELSADRGLNFATLNLTTDETFKELLEDEAKESYKAGENGSYYLAVGEYTVRISVGDSNIETPLTINKPRDRPGRKE